MVEAEGELLALLAASGVNPGHVAASEVATVAAVYRQFASIIVTDVLPPDEDGDGVLAQFGTHDFRGKAAFAADLTRQFMQLDGEDEDDTCMWQLSCTIYWKPSTATRRLGAGDLWSFGSDLEDFFDEALAMPGWAWALQGGRDAT